MPKLIYYVASSLDGYIAGKGDDISKFVPSGNGVEQYLADLQEFETVIMGRRTYEFGYQYGMEPGQPAYPHMEHYIFSNSMHLDSLASNVHIEKINLKRIQQILDDSKTDVYLCGGGQFAGWLFDNRMIDVLKLKLNPIVLGSGIPLFGDSKTALVGKLIEKQSCDFGLEIISYDLK